MSHTRKPYTSVSIDVNTRSASRTLIQIIWIGTPIDVSIIQEFVNWMNIEVVCG